MATLFWFRIFSVNFTKIALVYDAPMVMHYILFSVLDLILFTFPFLDVRGSEAWRNSSNTHQCIIPIFALWWLELLKIILSFHLLSSNHFLIASVSPVLSVDAIDMSGKHEVDLDTNIWKVRHLLFSFSNLTVNVDAILCLLSCWYGFPWRKISLC